MEGQPLERGEHGGGRPLSPGQQARADPLRGPSLGEPIKGAEEERAPRVRTGEPEDPARRWLWTASTAPAPVGQGGTCLRSAARRFPCTCFSDSLILDDLEDRHQSIVGCGVGTGRVQGCQGRKGVPRGPTLAEG